MAQDIKTAFFDIDGTLTSFVTHVVPQSTVDALHALQRNGVKVFICSGRAPSYMGVVLDTIPVTFDGIVGLNGQYCTTRRRSRHTGHPDLTRPREADHRLLETHCRRVRQLMRKATTGISIVQRTPQMERTRKQSSRSRRARRKV